MKFKTIYIDNFGKLNKKKIDLKDGINVVYGPNESGKSTIFSFIRGVLYGFSTSAKRRSFEVAAESYKPWTGEGFGGYIELEDKDTYRIDKDFNLTKDSVKVTDISTGEDATEKIISYENSKVEQPGAKFFEMSKELYESTALMLNLPSSPDVKMEITEKLRNFYSTKSEGVSFQSARENLQRKLDDLGTERRQKSKIGSSALRVAELSEIIKTGMDIEKYEKAEEEVADLKSQIKVLENKKKNKEYIDAQKIYDEVYANTQKINALKRELQNCDLEEYKDYEEALELSIKRDGLKEKLTTLKEENIEAPETDEEFEKDYIKFNKLMEIAKGEEPEKVLEKIDAKNNEKDLGKYVRKYYTFIGIAAALMVIGGALYYLFKNISYLMIFIPAVLIIIYSVAKVVVYAGAKKRTSDKLKEINSEEQGKEEERTRAVRALMEMAKNYNFTTVRELEREMYTRRERENLKVAQISRLKQKGIDNAAHIKKIQTIIAEVDKRLSDIFENRSVANLEELRLAQERDNPVTKITMAIKILIEKNKNLIGDGILKDLNKFYTPFATCEDDSFEEFRRAEGELGSKREILDRHEVDLKKVRWAKEELSLEQEKLRKLLFEKRSLELALQTMESVEGKITKENTPLFKQTLEEIFAAITLRRYEKVFMDEEFNLTVYDREKDKYVRSMDLSKGTFYQLYFAFRLALLKPFEKNIPMILDDGFVEYDEKRLREVLKYLAKEDRQFIIFTHGNREREILDRENIPYNLVNLEGV